MKMLSEKPCRLVYFISQKDAGGVILRSAANQGIFGPDSGFLWVFPDVLARNFDEPTSSTAALDGITSSGVTIPGIDVAAMMKGSLSTSPNPPAGPAYEGFIERYAKLKSTTGTCGHDKPLSSECNCFNKTDSAGTALFQVRMVGYQCFD